MKYQFKDIYSEMKSYITYTKVVKLRRMNWAKTGARMVR
jgi:hypothetical protein